MGFDTIYGVDFSAHSRNAGNKTWVTEASPSQNVLAVSQSACAYDEFELGSAGREATLDALVSFIAARNDALVGLDFPFSLPQSVIKDRFDPSNWVDFLTEFTNEWGSPREMFDDVNDEEGTVLRGTDEQHGGQPPVGWRIKTQTYYGISRVLVPLVTQHEARIPPLHTEGNGPVLIETYPAASFDEAGLHRDGYKDVPLESRVRRKENVRGLQHRGVKLPDETTCVAVHNDDALDSITAAYAAWKHVDEDFGEAETLEGYIYV